MSLQPDEGILTVRRSKSFSLPALFGLAWRNLLADRLRTFLSALIISFGVAMVIASEFTSSSLLDAFSDVGDGDLEVTHGFMVEQFDLMLSGIGYVLLAAAAFLIFNTFAMTITQRRKQIGLLRCLGMTRSQVLRLVLLEALLLGGIGTGLGLLAGPTLGQSIVTMMRLLAGDILGFGAGSYSAGTTLLATLLGMSITVIAVLGPAWRATRVAPLAALREVGASAQTGISTQTPAARSSSQPHLLSRPPVVLAVVFVLYAFLAIFSPGAWLQSPWNSLFAILFVMLWLACVVLLLPVLLVQIGGAARHLWGNRSANGRIAADNLQRAPGRSILTAITLAIGLTTIIALTGLMTFAFDDLFGFMFDRMVEEEMWAVFPFDLEQGTAALGGVDALQLPQEQIDAFHQEVGDRADITPIRFADVPELSFMGSSYFSFIVEPAALRRGFFIMQQGDWETALPLLEKECAALVAPAVAQRLGVEIGDSFTLTGADGPASCTLAGIGAGFGNASVLGPGAADTVGATEIVSLVLTPHPDANLPELIDDMQQIADRSDKAFLTSMRSYVELMDEVIGLFGAAMSGILLLAVVAAALGVVNTMIMSVNERRRELGLLRAVGATRRQVTAVVTGEAALIGAVGGLAGFVAGCGAIIIFTVTYGGNSWGVVDLDLWGAAGRALRSAAGSGLAGLIIVPIISAAAARWPARSILRGTAVETLQGQFPESGASAPAAWYRRGSLRVRFVVGTGLLLLLVLAGLATAVTVHARDRMESEMDDALRTLVTLNAAIIELGLPADATTLDLDALQGNGMLAFDAEMLLRFEEIVDGIAEQGLEAFRIVNQDRIMLFSLDEREMGTLWEDAPTVGSAAGVASIRQQDIWQMEAAAPIENKSGNQLGAVYLTFNAREITDFLTQLQRQLWLAGSSIVLLGCAVAWLITSGHKPGVTQQRLRFRLTIIMVLLAAGLTGILQLITIPVERRQLEKTLQEGLIAGVAWGSELVSEAALANGDFNPADLTAIFNEPEAGSTNLESLGRLQELVDAVQTDDLAFSALQDESGKIVAADQLSLVGETAVLPDTTVLHEETWRGETLWVITSPLTAEDGERIGGWRLGVRADSVAIFLEESRAIFRMAGVIALLAGALLAQVVGTAVVAPLESTRPSVAARPAGPIS